MTSDTNTPQAAVVLDTPAKIERYQLAVFIARLRLEVRTGLRSRMPVAKLARERYGLTGHRKKDVLSELEALYLASYGVPYGKEG